METYVQLVHWFALGAASAAVTWFVGSATVLAVKMRRRARKAANL